MLNLKKLKVKKIEKVTEGKIEVLLEDGSKAIGYPQFTPEVKAGDEVVVNTTAVDLGLGSGGFHFILYNLSQTPSDIPAATGGTSSHQPSADDGHIIKMRYTPLQFSTLAVESPESGHHDTLSDKLSIDGLPVIAGSLHSQLAATVATAKYLNPQIKMAYIMTDGGSLPIGLSNTVSELKEKALLDCTITGGQAFGGDFEAVNIYSALICARYAAKADVVFVSMGPGVVGTSTLLGNTAVEVGQIVNAVYSLGGRPIVIPRLSFKDKRLRHQGLSHHTITALSKLTLGRAFVVIPQLEKKKMNFVNKQIQMSGIQKQHLVQYINNLVTDKALAKFKLRPTTMGRSFDEEPEFFLACGCGAIKALDMVGKGG